MTIMSSGNMKTYGRYQIIVTSGVFAGVLLVK